MQRQLQFYRGREGHISYQLNFNRGRDKYTARGVPNIRPFPRIQYKGLYSAE